MNAFFIISNNNLALENDENVAKFISIYISWIEKISGNITSISGNIAKQNWLPINESNQ